jgi:hypothetical protein
MHRGKLEGDSTMRISKSVRADLATLVCEMGNSGTIQEHDTRHARLLELADEIHSEIAYAAWQLDHAQQNSPNANHKDKP